MEYIIAAVLVVLLTWLFSSVKKRNQELNDHYPFDPRKPKL